MVVRFLFILLISGLAWAQDGTGQLVVSKNPAPIELDLVYRGKIQPLYEVKKKL